MKAKIIQPDDHMPAAGDPNQGEFLTPFGQPTSMAKQASCEHEWGWDGQTMTAVRWTCAKCGKSELR